MNGEVREGVGRGMLKSPPAAFIGVVTMVNLVNGKWCVNLYIYIYVFDLETFRARCLDIDTHHIANS